MFGEESGKDKAKRYHSSVFLKEIFLKVTVEAVLSAQSFIN